ncbi:unnamed protein product [Microthlaspi erraticum]|uniref:Uncharacterized protein n=1 Tax=Microthlaspi erraticum TaxID=1685480 RepID=A0A6D2IVP7_9BRAS|nr:unnamed protein product [Microthlaspi erraticum]
MEPDLSYRAPGLKTKKSASVLHSSQNSGSKSFLALLLNVEVQALFIKLQKNGIYIPKERYAQEEAEKKASKDKKSLDVGANLLIGNQALHWKPICMQDYTEAATVVFLFCVADGSFAKAKPFS